MTENLWVNSPALEHKPTAPTKAQSEATHKFFQPETEQPADLDAERAQALREWKESDGE
jgi:hypothetical protein